MPPASAQPLIGNNRIDQHVTDSQWKKKKQIPNISRLLSLSSFAFIGSIQIFSSYSFPLANSIRKEWPLYNYSPITLKH